MHFNTEEERRQWVQTNYEERFRTWEWIGGSLYDTPDGEDLSGKMWYATKFGSALGIITGLGNANSIHPFSYVFKDKVIRFGKSFFPVVFGANVFVFTTYMVANARKKDDFINHALGGATAGTVFGAACKNYRTGAAFMIGLAVLAGGLKFSHMYGVPLMHSPADNYHTSFFMRKFDTTLYKDDIRGNWTREPKN